MKNKHQIFLISDSTGETLDRIFMALKAQFNNFEYELNQFSFTRTETQISTILKDAKKLLSKEGIKWECGQHSIENLISADYVVKSPGIPSDTPIIKLLRKKRKNIISEIEFPAISVPETVNDVLD